MADSAAFPLNWFSFQTQILNIVPLCYPLKVHSFPWFPETLLSLSALCLCQVTVPNLRCLLGQKFYYLRKPLPENVIFLEKFKSQLPPVKMERWGHRGDKTDNWTLEINLKTPVSQNLQISPAPSQVFQSGWKAVKQALRCIIFYWFLITGSY